MTSVQMYSELLGIQDPWEVRDVGIDFEKQEVLVKVGVRADWTPVWEPTGKPASIHDHRLRRWRHLDTCQCMTVIEARVPRLKINGEIRQIPVPWADSGSGFTAMFEAFAVTILQIASLSRAAKLLRISWDQADGIMRRAVKRGLDRRPRKAIKVLGVDEKMACAKGATIVADLSDPERIRVDDVLTGIDAAPLKDYFSQMPEWMRDAVSSVSMDMSRSYISAVRASFPNADELLNFDRFHISKMSNEALKRVYRSEVTTSDEIKGSYYLWLRGQENFDKVSDERVAEFTRLCRGISRTARAWRLKEALRVSGVLNIPGSGRFEIPFFFPFFRSIFFQGIPRSLILIFLG